MAEPEGIRTVTMARIYAQQGHIRRAVEIYRYLVEAHPDRNDLREELTELETRMVAGEGTQKNLEKLLVEWVRLLSAYRQLQILKEIKQKFVVHREDENDGGQGF
jgi:hypothetical protein